MAKERKNSSKIGEEWRKKEKKMKGRREIGAGQADGNMHVMCAAEKLNVSTSLENDNMCYVSFKIREQECIPWYGEIQNRRLEVVGKTFNVHSNST